MKIELIRIYGNKPYYAITQQDGSCGYAIGYAGAEEEVRAAQKRGEEIELVEAKFMEEHSKLVGLLNNKTEEPRREK